MMRAKNLLLAAGLLGGLMMAAPASAVPAGPSGLEAAPATIQQVRMMRGERMERHRMMRHRMMRHRMMRHRMMRNRM